MARHDHHRADRLTRRAAFYAYPKIERDPDGRRFGPRTHQFTVSANVLPIRGGESIMQARMVSKNPAIVTVRLSEQTRQITAEWEIEIDGQKYDVKERPRESADRAFLEMLTEA